MARQQPGSSIVCRRAKAPCLVGRLSSNVSQQLAASAALGNTARLRRLAPANRPPCHGSGPHRASRSAPLVGLARAPASWRVACPPPGAVAAAAISPLAASCLAPSASPIGSARHPAGWRRASSQRSAGSQRPLPRLCARRQRVSASSSRPWPRRALAVCALLANPLLESRPQAAGRFGPATAGRYHCLSPAQSSPPLGSAQLER